MGTKKSIFIILVLQTALLLFLSFRILSGESRAPAAINSPTASTSYTQPKVTSSTMNEARADEFVRRDDIRAVVREEMDMMADKIIDAIEQRSETIQDLPVATMDPRELAGLRAEVTGQINSFSGQGVITPTQLSRLEQTISRLPPRERIKALSELNRAINNGNIEARF